MRDETNGSVALAHPAEPHTARSGTRLNWLRAGVLGANDGIVSVAGIVIGVAAATSNSTAILTAADAFAAHAEAELGIDPDDLTNPVHAALSSALSFTLGALLPLLAILTPQAIRVPLTMGAVLAALALTGAVGAYLGQAPVARATVRVLAGGALAMMTTYTIGHLVGIAI
ncbi:VIT1/CCC1 transporter family protein [Nocardia tengchongensis]|uniref:VIT1/CCC1 transporter family protein n=1 Tax=Nocardia tengchongensis TaxID=2055889 RepID=UPI00368B6C71